jgi:hypothetical protein
MGPVLRVNGALFAFCVALPASAGDPTLAESLFREGKELMGHGDLRAACPKFAESFRQDPATGTLLALAICQERDGKLASAWTSFNAVLGRAQQEGREDRIKAAKERIAALGPRLARLTVVVAPERPPGLEVKRDGLVLPEVAWGSATPVDPGDHVIEATAPGHEPFRRQITVAREGERLRVEIPSLAAKSGRPVPSQTAGAAHPPPSSERRGVTQPSGVRRSSRDAGDLEEGMSPLSLAGVGTGVVGLAALGVGTFFTMRMLARDEDAREAGCSEITRQCPYDGRAYEAAHDARKFGDYATGFWVAGGALLAGGVLLYVLGRPSEPSAPAGTVGVAVRPGALSLALSGDF